MFNIEEELKKLPGKPGVYLMHDAKDEIIYVGKAISLKNRVRQYFQKSRNRSSKIEKMVNSIDHFEYIITDSELEALVLECNLIKEHRPRYNTMLKDSKGYPYIKITMYEDFPRVMVCYSMKKDKSKYFGPYTNVTAMKESLEMVRKLFQIRTCNRNLPKDIGRDRPCLNYHIKQCKAPCQGYVSKEEYRKSIDEVINFLNGKYDKILKILQEKMENASDNMEFEDAIKYRDLMQSVKVVAQKQKITNDSLEDRDIIAFASEGQESVVQVFFVREGKLIGRDHFYVRVADGDTDEMMLGSFVKQFYAGTPIIPREIYLQNSIEDQEMITEWLTKKRGRKVEFVVPKKGDKEKLVELAKKNAELVLSQDRERIKREELRTIGAVKQIADILDMERLIRMEAYDISNTSGFEPVGSMVVFENGKPKRSDYRKFKIKWVEGPNDYAAMEEVLTRRLEHIKNELSLSQKTDTLHSLIKIPDLILMDGGKGQVNVALKVLEDLQLSIPVCGMVKDDNHRTRGLYFNNVELPIDRHSEGFKLITRIQDEAHRFAIEYHRSLRDKKQVHSVLDDINGVGPKRRKELMRHFGSIENIKLASVESLMKIDGITEQLANRIYAFFHRE